MINFAHRGASAIYPENTILAFKKAIEINSDGIELDVHKSKDNKLVVIHDEDIRRTYDGEGLVQNFTLEELKRFKNKSKDYSENIECRIPTLEEVLKLIKDTRIILNIELKTDEIHYFNIEEDVLNLINKYGIKNRVIISSFNHESLKICRSLDSEIKLGVLYDKKIENVISYAKDLKANAIHPDVTLVNKELIEEAHRNNVKVNTYTVDCKEIMKNLYSLGVDGVFTNKPDLLKKVIKEQF